MSYIQPKSPTKKPSNYDRRPQPALFLLLVAVYQPLALELEEMKLVRLVKPAMRPHVQPCSWRTRGQRGCTRPAVFAARAASGSPKARRASDGARSLQCAGQATDTARGGGSSVQGERSARQGSGDVWGR